MTAAELQPFLQQMDAAIAAAERSVAGISDETLRAQHTGTVATMSKAVASWKGPQRDEVLRGVRPFARWRDWGAELITQIAREVRDAGDFVAQFSRAANVAGNAAQWVVDRFAFVGEKLAQLEKQDRELAGRIAAFTAQRKLLQGRKVSPGLGELLGPKGDAALASYQRFHRLVSGLRAAVQLVGSGKATLTPNGKGDLDIVRHDGGGSTLGVAPVLAAGTVIAVVAVCGALGTSLFVFFRHLDEATRAEMTAAKLALIREGRGREVLALEKLEVEAEKSRNGSSLASALKWIAGALGVAGAIWGVVELSKVVNGRRAAA